MKLFIGYWLKLQLERRTCGVEAYHERHFGRLCRLSRTHTCAGPARHRSGWRGGAFQLGNPTHGLFAVFAAHLARRLQSGAKCRTLRPPEDGAALVGQQLHAAHAGGFAIWHAWNGGVDGGRGTARPAAGAAVERRGRRIHGRQYTSSRWLARIPASGPQAFISACARTSARARSPSRRPFSPARQFRRRASAPACP